MKSTLIIVAGAILGLTTYVLFGSQKDATPPSLVLEEEVTQMVEREEMPQNIKDGVYSILTEKSEIKWAGKKPLIDGYINSGTLDIIDGSITIHGASSTGNFQIDMATLSVTETKAKPGQESTLEGHLKGERWFNVKEFGSANFTLEKIIKNNTGDAEFSYDIVGELTLKGITDTLSFPAKIYQGNDGFLHAEAQFEFDRTKWGITAGSGSFFDNLENSVIDDMVAMQFHLVAEMNKESMQ